jgi:flagellar M-ring protein FliF
MNLLGKFGDQLSTIVRGMTPMARVVGAAALVLVVVGVLAASWLPTLDSHVALMDGRLFTRQELATLELAFAKAGLNDWQIQGQQVRVPRAERFAYLTALSDHDGMPESFGSAWDRMLAANQWFEPSKLRELREKHAVEKELALVVSRMAGIEVATVRYDEVEQGGFPIRRLKTAMVAANASDSRGLNEDQVRSIRDLVAGSLAGLDAANVTVTDLGSGRTYPGGRKLDSAGPQQEYTAAKRMFENGWRERISDMLAMYPGVVVAVNVELASDQPFAGAWAAPDLRASEFVSEGQPPLTEAGEPADEPQRFTSYKTALMPRHVTASVSLPRSYFVRVWRQRNPTPAGSPPMVVPQEALRQLESGIQMTIQQQVLAVLPPDHQSSTAHPRVVVSTYDDVPSAEFPAVAAGNTVATADAARDWLNQHGQTVGLLVLAAVCLVLVLKLLAQRRTTPLPQSGELPVTGQRRETGSDTLAAEERGPQASWDAAVAGTSLGSEVPDTLRDELAALVNQDLDAAASVLRDWIGEAA